MKTVDVWFCRYDGRIWMGMSWPGQPPGKAARLKISVGQCLKNIRKQFEIGQVGIASPDMLGLGDND